MATATKTAPRKATKATITEATEAKAPATEPITIGGAPTEATATATEASPPAPTLQEAIDTEATAPPRVDADSVASVQKACFDRAIGRAVALATAENQTTIDM